MFEVPRTRIPRELTATSVSWAGLGQLPSYLDDGQNTVAVTATGSPWRTLLTGPVVMPYMAQH